MLRIRNFESAKLKVNDRDGNPIEIGAVVVWKVVDTAEACFEVDNYEHYMTVQTEAAIRNLASHGVGRGLHEEPTSIPTWHDPSERRRIRWRHADDILHPQRATRPG